MKKMLLAGLAGIALVAATAAQAAGDAANGQAKSAMCAGCHGADGNSAAPNFPKLAGQGAKYTAKQLADFKSGARQDASMAPMVAGLSEADMADLGAYYASQGNAPAAASEDNLDLGESIYRGGITEAEVPACIACHGPAGKGNPPAAYPALAAQHAAYTAKTLKDFRSGARDNDPSGMMSMVAKRMTDAEIEAVANYIQGLH